MSAYLLDHPNPSGPNYYDTRRGSILAIVVHVTAGLQGLPRGADRSAEDTARYAATTDRDVSWHSGSDRDSYLQLLPDSYTAWHCHGYNSRTIGHEISKRDVTWADEDPTWVTGTLEMAAACLAPRARLLGIPLRHASKSELDRAIATNGKPVGFIGHDVLDPTRRRDPGPDFPWRRFLELCTPLPAPPIPSPTPAPEDDMYAVVSDPAGSGDYGTNLVTKFPFPTQAAKNEWAQLVGAKRITLTPAAFAAIPTVKETT